MAAWVLMKLWVWLLVKIFDIDPINMTQAVALGIILGLVRFRYEKSEEQEFNSLLKTIFEKLIGMVFVYAYFILFAYVLRNFL